MTDYPLLNSEFTDLLEFAEVRMWLDWGQDVSGSGRGVRYVADIAPAVWRAELTLNPTLTHAEAAKVQAIIDSLEGARGSFYMYDPRLPYPINDPAGSIIRADSGTVQIDDIASSNRGIRLRNLPPNYKLAMGDRLHFNFGSNPIHRSYHRILNFNQASDTGLSGWLSIVPPLFDGAVDVGTNVAVGQPSAEWFIPPGGYQAGSGKRTLTPGGTLKIEQVI